MPFPFRRSRLKGSGEDTPPPPGGEPLYAGLSNVPFSEWGQGPGGGTNEPRWRATTISITPSQVPAVLQAATLHQVFVILNLAGARNVWCDPGPGGTFIYNEGLWRGRVNRFKPTTQGGQLTLANFNLLTAAFNTGIAAPLTVDEPQHSDFGDPGTITRDHVNRMGLHYKSIWPQCLTTVRATKNDLMACPNGTFNGIWNGLDYGWAQFNKGAANTHGNGFARRRLWFQERKAELLTIDMGYIGALNWLLGGDGRLWDHDMDPGTPVSRIQGQGGSDRWLSSPDEIRETADAVWDDPDMLCFVGYTHTPALPGTSEFVQYQNRADYVAAYDYLLTRCHSRSNANPRRTPK